MATVVCLFQKMFKYGTAFSFSHSDRGLAVVCVVVKQTSFAPLHGRCSAPEQLILSVESLHHAREWMLASKPLEDKTAGFASHADPRLSESVLILGSQIPEALHFSTCFVPTKPE
jgi:hypothetical protein